MSETIKSFRDLTMEKKIRVLVTDDSALMRKKISDLINSDPECETIATARNGEEALKVISTLKPDVVTLDLEMPKLDGVTALKYIMSEWPTPVVILTGYSKYQGKETIRCLEYGAVDLVMKPDGPVSVGLEPIREELLAKIKAAAQASLHILRPKFFESRSQEKKLTSLLQTSTKVVAIASSTGGPRALVEVLPKLPAALTAGILVIQHMPGGFTRSMAERLSQECAISVKEAEDGEPLKEGAAYIAPGGFHMKVASDHQSPILKLEKGPAGHGLSPSADLAMKSLAPLFGNKSMGVVLTGMGNDGVEGLREIKRYGGFTVAQDRRTSIVYGMPKAAVDANVVDRVVAIDQVADEIIQWAKKEERTALSGQRISYREKGVSVKR